MSLDFSKPIQTRDGRKVRILCTDRHGDYSVIALVGDVEMVEDYRLDGTNRYGCHDLSLVNVPSFDPLKPVRTRDGRKARILCTNLKNDTYPIAAAYMTREGEEVVETYAVTGYRYSDGTETTTDLVNI